MAHQVPWTKVILEAFLEESGLNDRVSLGDEKALILSNIMRTRVSGWSITKQALEYHISVDTVNKYIKELKKLYDATQMHSKILPKRITSKNK